MIFGKSKDEIFKDTQSEVFDIIRVGANISKLRKASGMTQTELADHLNVSYQAVSNWERGQSCPDISNLDGDVLDEIVEKFIEKHGIKALPSRFYPFIDSDMLENYLRNKMKNN